MYGIFAWFFSANPSREPAPTSDTEKTPNTNPSHADLAHWMELLRWGGSPKERSPHLGAKNPPEDTNPHDEAGFVEPHMLHIEPQKLDTQSDLVRALRDAVNAENRSLDAVNSALAACAMDLAEVDKDGRTVLMDAVRTGNVDIAAAIAKAATQGRAHDHCDPSGRNALHHAVISNDPRMISILNACEIDASQPDVNGDTALMLAVRNAGPAAVEAILSGTQNAGKLRDDHKEVSLFEAIDRGDPSILDVLLNSGLFNTVAPNPYGQTPLAYAVAQKKALCADAIHRHQDAVYNQFRKNHGSHEITDLAKESDAALAIVLDQAPKMGDWQWVEQIIRSSRLDGHDAKRNPAARAVNKRDSTGWCPIHHAVWDFDTYWPAKGPNPRKSL